MEQNYTTSYYVHQFLPLVRCLRLVQLAYFKGGLDLKSLGLLHRIVMRFAMWQLPTTQEGNSVSFESVRDWTSRLEAELGSTYLQ